MLIFIEDVLGNAEDREVITVTFIWKMEERDINHAEKVD